MEFPHPSIFCSTLIYLIYKNINISHFKLYNLHPVSPSLLTWPLLRGKDTPWYDLYLLCPLETSYIHRQGFWKVIRSWGHYSWLLLGGGIWPGEAVTGGMIWKNISPFLVSGFTLLSGCHGVISFASMYPSAMSSCMDRNVVSQKKPQVWLLSIVSLQQESDLKHILSIIDVSEYN